jgi:hypothetical protein
MRLFSLVAAAFFCSAVSAQTPGVGETRPAPAPSGGAEKKDELPKPAAESDRALARCQELAAEARDECMRKERERSAAAGADNPPGPPTAPPPQNPR